MIEVRNISVSFGSEQILRDVSLNVGHGEIVAILGPSGVGKTTLLRCIAGLLSVEKGEVSIDGIRPKNAARRQKIGFLFQQDSLLEWRSVSENVALPFEASNSTRYMDGAAQERVARALSLVGLSNVRRKFPRHLSGGMRQRVALARALAPDPDVLLLDEPFASIDLLTRENIMVDVHPILRSSGTPTVLVTHHIEEAVFLSNRLVVLEGKPATVAGTWEVPFDMQRDIGLLTDPKYVQLVVDLKAHLRTIGWRRP